MKAQKKDKEGAKPVKTFSHSVEQEREEGEVCYFSCRPGKGGTIPWKDEGSRGRAKPPKKRGERINVNANAWVNGSEVQD